MRTGLLIFMITAFFLVDAHEDGKYISMLKSWKKYYKMAAIVLAGVSAYAFLKRNPEGTRGLLSDASQLLRFVPVDKATASAVAPFLQSSAAAPAGGSGSRIQTSGAGGGPGSTRRSVSETKKKYVAAQQGWKCGGCQKSLPAWFEIDHQVRLDAGGSNHVSNLVALCRDCHGKKTAMENM
jgi:hypothetical protein